MVLGPHRVRGCRMTCKGAGGFGQEKVFAAHLAQVNITRQHMHKVKPSASR